MAFSHRQRRK